MNEITASAEQAIHSMEGPDGGTEPKLTLSQLRGLLREAAAYERAQRPIVLHESQRPAPAAQASTLGADVFVPMPPPVAVQAQHVPRERNVWPLVFMTAGGTGLGSGTAAVATSNIVAVLIACAAIAAWSTATYHLVFVREA